MLLLLLLDVQSIGAITADYIASERELESEKASRLKEIMSIGLNEEFAKCPEDFVGEMVRHLNESYGGLTEYMKGKVGVNAEMQNRILTILKEDVPDRAQ